MQTRSQLIHELLLNYKLEHQPKTRNLKIQHTFYFFIIWKVHIDMVCKTQLFTHEAALWTKKQQLFFLYSFVKENMNL